MGVDEHRPMVTPGPAPVPPPSRGAIRAAYSAVGFIPLHLIWALGVPLFAYPELFDPWYADGGGGYLWALNGLALLPIVLALALVRPWGLIFPRWVPGLSGRECLACC